MESDEQWASIEGQIRATIAQLPDADEFTQEDIGCIILRARLVNRDASRGQHRLRLRRGLGDAEPGVPAGIRDDDW